MLLKQKSRESSLRIAELEQYKGSLSNAERDKNIKAIASHLGLNQSDKEHLLGRGLTIEQINADGYFSIRPFSELPENISTRLAGVYIGKSGFPTIGSDFQQGIGCPIRDKDGLIVGYQIRRNNDPKYVWAKTSEKSEINRKKITSHLQTGELPLNYRFSQELDNKALFLCDGILKSRPKAREAAKSAK